jgi:hypothetical protein
MKRVDIKSRFVSPDGIEPEEFVIDDRRITVRGIGDRWLDEEANYFKVTGSDGLVYLLRLDLEDQTWTIVRSWQLDA